MSRRAHGYVNGNGQALIPLSRSSRRVPASSRSTADRTYEHKITRERQVLQTPDGVLITDRTTMEMRFGARGAPSRAPNNRPETAMPARQRAVNKPTLAGTCKGISKRTGNRCSAPATTDHYCGRHHSQGLCHARVAAHGLRCDKKRQGSSRWCGRHFGAWHGKESPRW